MGETISMTVEKQLGMRIRYLRTKKKLSQEDLALMSGVNKNYLSNLERGSRNPTLKLLEKICRGLDINLETLLKGIETF